MRRWTLLAAAIAATALLPARSTVYADSDVGGGPDEHHDETSPSEAPPNPVPTGGQAGNVTVMRVGGQIDDFRYDDLKTEGTAAEVCPGKIRDGTLRAFYEVVNRFGGLAGTMYACRERWDAANDPDCNGTVVNPRTNPGFSSTCWSNHASGRAFDVMVGGSASAGYNRQRGLNIVNWLLAPDAQNSTNSNARRLGVQQILFDDRCWNSDGDRGITSWNDMRECDIGHHDHVHVDMTHPGSFAQTSYWGAPPEVHPKPDTQVLWDRESFWREAVSWWNLGAENEEGLSLPAGYDEAITGDWDSDGIQDEIFLWDRDSGSWFVQNWNAGDSLNARMGQWTAVYDDIVAGDWDNDGFVDDMLVWDRDTGNWVIQSWSGYTPTYRGRGVWSQVYDRAIAGDFNGDGRLNDLMLWDRDSGLWVMQSWQAYRPTYRGRGTWSRVYDEIIVGDWSAGGDLDETIIWDRTTGSWVLQSWSGYRNRYVRQGTWSTTIGVAAPGDYDTDGRTDDLFLYSPSNGRWSIWSFHRNVPKPRLSGTWLDGFDVINVGSFSD